ncbi:hypothetical protein Dsin_023693 [Dipteronia sinensis]|uniref:Uncharacterized protein n=1 Tax=Dipteronia sinensis TaxID=43782 RepID=A0AAE0A3S3_9ROSI|nr:hypothetical protein Dsin_023693 [Dipteronia sinensis]
MQNPEIPPPPPPPPPPPQPTMIYNIPTENEKVWLFDKILTATDMSSNGLILLEKAIPYLVQLDDGNIKQRMKSPEGFPVSIHTPIGPVVEGILRKSCTNIKLLRKGWKIAMDNNQFVQGDDINCWSVFENGNLHLIIEKKVPNQGEAA